MLEILFVAFITWEMAQFSVLDLFCLCPNVELFKVLISRTFSISLSPPLPVSLCHCLSLSVSLLAGLALFQEELRELREQPIDPQAEQEIIDSIEEVYFSNDSFDMVQHELEVSVNALLTE